MTSAHQPSEHNQPYADQDRISGRGLIWLSLAAALLGITTAAGVWLFQHAVDVVRSLSTGAQLLSPWLFPLIIVAGGIVVSLITHYLGRRDELSAMAHIISRVAQQSGRLNKRDGLAYVIASALTLGIGVPVGADTPSAMIGGHLASWIGTRFRQPDVFVRALVVAGVGAGISATYFAQLAAIFFALEIVLGGFGGVVFVVPTLIAVASASMFIQFTGGAPAQFDVAVAGDRWFNLTMLLYVGVAIVASLAAIAYVNLLPRLTAFWARRNLPYWLKTALAGVLIGLAAIWIPGVTTNGQDQMREIFAGAPIPLGVLLALATATVILAPWSLGGGYVGGVIGPALVIGSALGAAYGDIVAVLLPGLGVSPQAFAMVATAAMLAGTLHAPLFGAMMIFEMANDYRFLVPLLLASAVGYGLARPFQPGSAYTFMLPRAGLRLTRGTFILAKQARGKDADVD